MINSSIIIVNYKVREEIIKCIGSIRKNTSGISYEIIVVDNGEDTKLESQLKKYKNVVYIKSKTNIGFGAGNNLGAKKARGKYLFFLNPDTEVLKNTIEVLCNFLDKNKQAGIVSPLIVDENSDTFKLEGYKELTPLNAIFSFSFLRKIFPSKTIFSIFTLEDWNRNPIRQVETAYGAALMIPKKIFDKFGGFDENFFLYFEENDISKRIRKLGYKIFINSSSRVVHKVAQSTKYLSNRKNIYEKSRFYYLKKHFGLLKALLTEFFLRINKTFLLILSAILIGLFLRINNLSNSMQFIGDQGWFYLSARDMLINGQIPLVGITSSHTWLHQGPLWTYMLSAALFLFNFNPVSGAYVTALFGILTVFLMYKIGSEMFSLKIGVIAALLYSVSPLVVFWDRIPFDPSPIPFFTVLYFYSIFKWVNGNIKYFPFIIFLIAILYNLELATFTLFFPLALLLIYGFIRKTDWYKNLLNRKILLYSTVGLIIPMFPVIIYDLSNGFKQTVVFLGWTIYKPFSFLIKNQSTDFLGNMKIMLEFLSLNLQKLIFPITLIAITLFLLSFMVLIYLTFKRNFKVQDSKSLLLLLLTISIAGLLINQIPSDAYLPITFPFIIFTVAIFSEFLLNNKETKYLAVLILLIILFSNIYHSYKYTLTSDLKNRIAVIDKVIALTNGREYNLIGKGPGSQFISFTMNYEYLLWWKGYEPSKKDVNLKIVITETREGIIVNKSL